MTEQNEGLVNEVGAQVVNLTSSRQRFVLPSALQNRTVTIKPKGIKCEHVYYGGERTNVPRFEFPDVTQVLRRRRGQCKKLMESQKVRIPASVLEGIEDQVLGFG